MRKNGSEPEAVGNFHHGGAQSLRRPAIFVSAGARCLRLSAIFIMACAEPETSRDFRPRGRTEPEAVGNFQHWAYHGHASRLKRPAIFGSGVPKKNSEPEAVGNFTISMQTA